MNTPKIQRSRFGIGDEEEHRSLVTEVLEDQTSSSPRRKNDGNNRIATVVGFLVLTVGVLFLSDSIEFNILRSKGADRNAIPTHITHKNDDTSTSTSTTSIVGDSGVAVNPGELAANTLPSSDDLQSTGTKSTTIDAIVESVSDIPATETATTETRRHEYTYTRRGQPMSDQDRQTMTEKWGTWSLVDTKQRPTHDIFAKYPNRDIPWKDFPSNAWQIDQEYLKKFLTEALSLVERAQEAILAEYGHTNGTWQERAAMFHLDMHERLGDIQFPKDYGGDKGGWTTTRSWEGLKRRLLHAIVTEDSFVFAMGGHSAAAGHGNHFQQSYTLQVQWILEAVFARLGVRHQARNFGNGGLGTIHNGLAAGSIYGPDVDFLMWDSGMTEREGEAMDAFARQAIFGSRKVPVLWSLPPQVSSFLHDQADVDVGVAGTGFAGLTELTNIEDINKIPWAAQYVRCSGELWNVCRDNEYIGNCWVDREDFVPPTAQGVPTGRARWHPGNRKHQVTGRILAFTLLSALKEALLIWQTSEGYILSDDAWHVTAYYENTRQKLSSLPPDIGFCNKYAELDLQFVCNYPMQARTEFTPRAFPALSSIRSLMSHQQLAMINKSEENIYLPPDVFNPALHPPRGEIDVLNIVENGIDFKSILYPDYSDFYTTPTFEIPPKVPLGKGITLNTKAGDQFCDGSVDSFCDRGASNNCLLYAHNDGRNGLLFDEFSGWITMKIPNMRNGFLVIKLETWHPSGSVRATTGWMSINNEDKRRNMGHFDENHTRPTRELGGEPPAFCDDFHFEYAIDGQVTSLSKDEFEERRNQVQRVVETVTLLKDPSFTEGVEKEVEVAIRMTGCKREKVFQLTHIYWS